MFNLKGRVAVITGASSGLGKQMSHAFANQGADLVLLARRMDRLEDLREELELKVVPTEDGQQMADEYKLPFKETSAKEGTNINEIFQELVEKIDEAFSKLETPKTDQKPKAQLSAGGKKKKMLKMKQKK